jgi:hypothetical protein
MSDRWSSRQEEDDVELQDDDERRHQREEEQEEHEAPDGVLLPGRFPGRSIASPKRVTRPISPQPLREQTRLQLGHPCLNEKTVKTAAAGDDSFVRCSSAPADGNPSIPAVLDSELANRGVH